MYRRMANSCGKGGGGGVGAEEVPSLPFCPGEFFNKGIKESKSTVFT